MSTEALEPVFRITHGGPSIGQEFIGTVLPLDCSLNAGDKLYAITPEWREAVIAAADEMSREWREAYVAFDFGEVEAQSRHLARHESARARLIELLGGAA